VRRTICASAPGVQVAFAALHDDVQLVFATKAFPCTAVLRPLRRGGLRLRRRQRGRARAGAASRDGSQEDPPARNAKSERELTEALDAGIGDIVVDNFDDLDSSTAARRSRRRPRPAGPAAHHPDVAGDTHAAISTGQADSKFGFGLDEAREAIDRVERHDRLTLTGLHAHIGSQLLALQPFRLAVAAMASLGHFATVNLGGGLGVAYHRAEEAPRIADYARAKVDAVHEHFGPGRHDHGRARPRAWSPTGCVTIYTVESVKRNVSTVGRGSTAGCPDNLRPMLYGARYEAEVADNFGGGTHCHLVGKHCESGDVIIQAADLADPSPATWSSRRRRAATATPWPTTTTASRAPGRLLQGRRGTGRRAPRDLRRPDREGPVSQGDGTFRIGLLGHGTVGGAFAELVEQRASAIEAITGMRPQVSGVLTRSQGDASRSSRARTSIVEAMGGIEPARDLVLQAMRRASTS
jgi:diaminopimelate decarboxylase